MRSFPRLGRVRALTWRCVIFSGSPPSVEEPIHLMTSREFAALASKFGAVIVERDGRPWRRVRPFFYRPLLSVEPVTEPVARPCRWPGGYQYVVTDPGRANSTLNFILLERPRDYDLGGLSHRRRNLIRRAAAQFTVRRIDNLAEFKERGHQAYRSFFQRTKYRYKTDRNNPERFAAWATSIFHQPKVLLLGGYGAEGLVAFSCSYLVEGTLFYNTFVAESASLRRNVGEVMLHELRRRAAVEPRVKQILIRHYNGGGPMDQYYLLRGGTLVRKPARLELSSPMRVALQRLAPRLYSRLSGRL